jgi:hypothetical protein
MDTSPGLSRLTSSEMSGFWTGLMFVSPIHYVLKSFLTHVEDETIRTFVELCHTKSKEHMDGIISFLNKENFPVPRAITQNDVNLETPRLYSDVFYLNYLKQMTQSALMTYATFYSGSTRNDIRQFFGKLVDDLQSLDDKAIEILLSKGLYTRSPYIPIPKEAEVVKKSNLLTGFFNNNRRHLTVMEINQLFLNAQTNALGKAFLTGFLQVVQSKKIKEYLIRGQELSNKYYKTFSNLLLDEDLAIPTTFDGEVLESTQSPFSDRLMLIHLSVLFYIGLGNYGMALATSNRSDLTTLYYNVIEEVIAYAKDGMNILIENGWLEQPPLAPDRKALSQQKQSP